MLPPEIMKKLSEHKLNLDVYIDDEEDFPLEK